MSEKYVNLYITILKNICSEVGVHDLYCYLAGSARNMESWGQGLESSVAYRVGQTAARPLRDALGHQSTKKKKRVHPPVFPSRNCGSWSSAAAGPGCYTYSVSEKSCS